MVLLTTGWTFALKAFPRPTIVLIGFGLARIDHDMRSQQDGHKSRSFAHVVQTQVWPHGCSTTHAKEVLIEKFRNNIRYQDQNWFVTMKHVWFCKQWHVYDAQTITSNVAMGLHFSKQMMHWGLVVSNHGEFPLSPSTNDDFCENAGGGHFFEATSAYSSPHAPLLGMKLSWLADVWVLKEGSCIVEFVSPRCWKIVCGPSQPREGQHQQRKRTYDSHRGKENAEPNRIDTTTPTLGLPISHIAKLADQKGNATRQEHTTAHSFETNSPPKGTPPLDQWSITSDRTHKLQRKLMRKQEKRQDKHKCTNLSADPRGDAPLGLDAREIRTDWRRSSATSPLRSGSYLRSLLNSGRLLLRKTGTAGASVDTSKGASVGRSIRTLPHHQAPQATDPDIRGEDDQIDLQDAQLSGGHNYKRWDQRQVPTSRTKRRCLFGPNNRRSKSAHSFDVPNTSHPIRLPPSDLAGRPPPSRSCEVK